uniref:ABC transporter G family member 23 n=1 Tax=Cacopsylla melanoneura TaxID=428564 RepID=A0A8D8X953_9HEMI
MLHFIHSYGLLGSSGCGKTTLLTSLTGFSSLDYGSIHIDIQSPSRLGFMPQEIALFEEFSIAETFSFFAKLYNIAPETYQATIKELKTVLDLPPDNQLCSTLSGGQARRVSIAVTLLHSPDIIVLDEPTSGVDPLLAHYLWQYLHRLATMDGRTIIITTHYIEEARQANMVALMRQGVLLAEAPPEDLIKQYHATTLEDVFLQLCYKQNQNQDSQADNNHYISKIVFKNPYKDKSQHISAVWPHTQAILYKIITWCKRNFPVFITLSFGLSIMCIVFCNEMMTDFPPTTVGFVNHESGGNCDDPNLYNMTIPCGRYAEYENLGCRFINNWRNRNPKMPMVYYSKYEDAMYDGKRTKIAAVLEIPEIFSQGISARLSHGRNADPDLIGNSSINVWGDTTDYMRTLKVEVEIQASFIEMYRTLLTSCGYDTRVADMPPMRIKTNLFIGEDVVVDMFDYTVYVAMNIISGLACLCSALLLMPLLSVDKMSGVYARCHLAGVRIFEIFLGHIIFLIGYNMVNTAVMLTVYHTFYWKPKGKVWLSFLLLNVEGLSGIMLSLLVICLTDNITQCTSFLIVYIIAMFSFTGYIWPTEAVWPPIKPLSHLVFPNTRISEAYRAVEFKQAGILHKEVVGSLVYSFFYVLLHAAVIWLLIRKKTSFSSL